MYYKTLTFKILNYSYATRVLWYILFIPVQAQDFNDALKLKYIKTLHK
jgi:hypothetical protein